MKAPAVGAGWGGEAFYSALNSTEASERRKELNTARALLNQGNTISSLSDPNLASTLLLLINNSESSMMQSQCSTIRGTHCRKSDHSGPI